ncbi:hypothetical protein VNI00_000860 [Paramarasmius palmivorus]|uniref:ABC transmembrane type-1 domain-containing protein n=1 Tax=Paramarasmius palmivorus TaxID=297713 RepID=A0AAW0EA14_9AGAR
MSSSNCRDDEGWATVSPLREFDLTPCFEEGILLSSFYTVLFIIAAVRSIILYRTGALERSTKSHWILQGKIVILVLAFLASIVNLALVLSSGKRVAIPQSYALEPLSLLAAISLTHANHSRTRRSSSTLLIYWPLYTIAVVIWGRTLLLKAPVDLRLPFALKCTTCVLGLLAFALECISPDVGLQPKDGVHHEHPTLTANVFSIWTFGWMTPLMKKGASQVVTEEDLPDVSPKDECENLEKRLQEALQKHSLWKSLFIAYGGPYAFAALLKFIQDALAFLQPQLLRWLLAYISTYQSARLWSSDLQKPSPMEGFAIAALMLLASAAQTILLNQYFQRAFETGMRIRAGLVSVIYNKALALSNDELGRASGDIVNLMSVDATRLQDFCQFGLISISDYLGIHQFVQPSWLACFVGVAIMIFSIPLNTRTLINYEKVYLANIVIVMARVMKKMQQKQMKNRDRRTRLMSELLANIKSIKLYAWEFTFMRKILQTRNEQELVMLKKLGVVTSFNTMLWSGIPLLVAFSSFAVAAATSDKPLTADVIFPAISLFLLLQFPLAMFSQVTSNIIESIVSLQRISQFLKAEELQTDARQVVQKSRLQRGDEVLVIKDGEFSWSKTSANPTLEDVNLTVRKGELVGVLGRVGSGKVWV